MIVFTLVLALSVGFANLGSDRADLREFVDLAKRAALEQEALAADFRDFMNFEIRAADRDRISALFGSIADNATSHLADLAALDVPASGATAAALFNETLEAWLAGSAALEGGLLAAADEPESPIPVITIDNALTEIRVGDRLYERFLLALGGLQDDLETEIGVVPAVAYAPVNGLVLVGDDLAEAVRGADEVAASHDVRIGTIQLDPNFTGGDHDGVGVLAFTDSVSVSVVVSNTGNLVETDLILFAQVARVSDGVRVFEDSTTILTLEPGASRTVDFLDIPVVDGVTHEVVAVVTVVPDDIDSDNNMSSLPFFVQSAS